MGGRVELSVLDRVNIYFVAPVKGVGLYLVSADWYIGALSFTGVTAVLITIV
ncbi:hypothetical protein L195_g061240, partial [Trifolium pratense]